MVTLWHVLTNCWRFLSHRREVAHYIRDYYVTYMSLHWKTDSLCLLLWWRVPVCFGECVAPMPVFLLMQVALRRREWSSLTGERRGRWGVTLQPPSTPWAWAHSVMKWPVSWRPCPNNGPIQPGEESLSGLGWTRYLWFRAAVSLSFKLTIFYCSCYHSPLLSLCFTLSASLRCFLVLSFLLPRISAYRNKSVKSYTKNLKHTQCSHVHVFKRYQVSLLTCLHEHHLCFHWSHFGFMYYCIVFHVIKGFWYLICFEFFGCWIVFSWL